MMTDNNPQPSMPSIPSAEGAAVIVQNTNPPNSNPQNAGGSASISNVSESHLESNSPAAHLRTSRELEELQQQLVQWVAELDAEATMEEPDETEQQVRAQIEFLSHLSQEELLQSAIEVHAERDTLFRHLARMPSISQLEEMRDRFKGALNELYLLRDENEKLEQTVVKLSLEVDQRIFDSSVDESAEQVQHESEDEAQPAEVNLNLPPISDWERQKQSWLSQLDDDGEVDGSKPLPPAFEPERESKSEPESRKVSPGRDEFLTLRKRVLELEAELRKKSRADQLVNEHDIIQDELKRIEALQNEWKAKIRDAELQLSKERAEITRRSMKVEEREHRVNAMKESLEGRSNGAEQTNSWRDYFGMK